MNAIVTNGSQTYGGTANKITQFNVAGLFYAVSGIFFQSGVKNAWIDPDRTVISDPYMRISGWDGTVTGETYLGRPVGCSDYTADQVRNGSASGYGMETFTGGLTIEYGMPSWVMRLVGGVGSAESPFIIRLKDWGVSGPGTGYTAGVRPRNTSQVILFKGDPANNLGSSPSRFVRWIKLPDTYGSGPYVNAQTTPPCSMALGGDGPPSLMRFESNVVGGETRDYWFEFAGDWTTNFVRSAELISFGDDSYNNTQANHSNVVRLASGAALPSDTITLRDRSTVSGPGTWGNLAVEDASAVIQGKDSTITDTNVSGTVAVGANTDRTTISNVNFTGTTRAIVTIGSSATVTMTDICAPSNSTVTGTGTLTYEGSTRTLPYTLVNEQNCNITQNARPDAPGAP
jgi:hypothetical protein